MPAAAGHHQSRPYRAQDGRTYSARGRYQAKAANYTVTEDDSGSTFEATAADVVFTLPPTVEGLSFKFITGVLSTGTGMSVSPNAVDSIRGGAITTVADDKDYINSGATDVVGDLVEVLGDGAAGWIVTNQRGTWARET